MLIETQVVRSKSELMKELQGLPVAKAVIYRNVDRNMSKPLAQLHQAARAAATLICMGAMHADEMQALYSSQGG